MSVDAFGRTLKRSATGERGPPGIGYKLTSDGHFDAENKKLCNLADPTQPSDGVNLNILKTLVESEIKDTLQIVSRLREDLDNLEVKVKEHRRDVDENVTKLYFMIQENNEKSNGNGR